MKTLNLCTICFVACSAFAETNNWRGLKIPLREDTIESANTQFAEPLSEFSELTNRLAKFSPQGTMQPEPTTAIVHDFLSYMSKGPTSEYKMMRTGTRQVALGTAGKYEWVHAHSKEEVEQGVARNDFTRKMFLLDFANTYTNRNALQQRIQFEIIKCVWFGDMLNRGVQQPFIDRRANDGITDPRAFLTSVLDYTNKPSDIEGEILYIVNTLFPDENGNGEDASDLADFKSTPVNVDLRKRDSHSDSKDESPER